MSKACVYPCISNNRSFLDVRLGIEAYQTKRWRHTLPVELASVVDISCRSKKSILVPQVLLRFSVAVCVDCSVCRTEEQKSMLAGTYTRTAAFHVCFVQTRHLRTVIVYHRCICCLPYIDQVTKSRFFEWPIKYGIQTKTSPRECG